MLRHKFNAKRVEDREGFKYPSKKQYARKVELDIFKKIGDVLFFLEEVPIRLPGKTIYRIDFLIFWADGSVTFEDSKGMKTSMYQLKKRQVEELYPFKIIEV